MKGGLVAAERVERLAREEASVREHHVERLDGVPLALDVAVADGGGPGGGRDPEHAVVEHAENVDARQAATRVAGARVRDRPHGVAAILDRLSGEVAVGHGRACLLYTSDAADE